MTKGLWLFFAFYLLVCQPALIWRMWDNSNLYQLAWLNAGVFFIAWIISTMCRPVHKHKSRKEEIATINEGNKELVESTPSGEVLEMSEEEKKENSDLEAEDREPEKPVKESVSIPKIVQPLTNHAPVKKKKRKERKIWQRLVLLFTLWISAIIAWTLWEFLWNRGIAIALFLGRILYLIIWKLFDLNGFHSAKKLFTNRLYILLILWWIWYWVFTSQQEWSLLNSLPDNWSDKVSAYISNLMKSDKGDDENENEIYVFEWTWEVILNSDSDLDLSWNVEEILSWDQATWAEMNAIDIQNNTWLQEMTWTQTSKTVDEQILEPTTSTLSPEEAKKQVTMWEAIKSLLAWYTLSTKTNVTFKFVAKSNELYPYFKTAQEKTMIWTDTDPSKIVSCETFITMKWILEWRNVGNYAKWEIKSAYWKKAQELWKLNGCTKWAYLKKWNL